MLFNFWKNIPASVRVLIRPMWCVSVGLHGLLLILPIPSTPDPKASSPKKEPIKITQLPSQPSPKLSPVVQPPQPSPIVQQNPLPPNRPPIKALPTKPAPIVESSRPSPRLQQIAPSPYPATTSTPIVSSTPTPSPTPIASPSPTTTPTPIASPSPTTTPTPIASPSPTPTPTPIASPSPTPTPTPTTPFAGIPELAGVKPGCNGQQGCWQVEGTNMRAVASNLLEQFLAAQGYTLQGEEDIADDTGRSVYKVSNKNGQTEYLHLLSTDDGPVLLFSDKNNLTREELIALAQR